MHDVIVVGDGPGGLSAALLLGKKGMRVVVFGGDETPMHRARLRNYLGVDEITGTEFQTRARKQVRAFGAQIREGRAAHVVVTNDGFEVGVGPDDALPCKYLLLANGDTAMLDRLGVDKTRDGYTVDVRTGRTSVPRLYATGWAIRQKRTQAIIAAGDGAAVALDILSTEAGRDINDFDVVPK